MSSINDGKISMKSAISTRAAGVVAAGVLGAAMSSTPAQAHQQTWEGKAYACAGYTWTVCGTYGVSSTHLTAIACDRRSDNWGAWVYWQRHNGSTGWAKDPDGNGGSCGTHSSSSSKVYRLKYCGHQNGTVRCNDWKYVS